MLAFAVLAALFALLKRAGYEVVQNRETNPRLGPHDVAICLTAGEITDATSSLGIPDKSEEFYSNLDKFVESGGSAVVFGYSKDFADASQRVNAVGPVAIKNELFPKTLHILSQGARGVSYPGEQQAQAWLPVWTENDVPIVQAERIGKGSIVVCQSSIPATNRFLDKVDDAEFVVSVIQTVARPGDRLVFTEGSFGNISDPGFFELLGTWALAAWRQAIVLFVVLVFTLGKRFGYPEERRRVIQSSRDLADAFGNLLQRSRRVDVCLQMALSRLDQRIRVQFRVPRDASIQERNRVLPENIVAAINRIEDAARDQYTRSPEALKLIQNANREIDEYTFAVPPR